MLRRSIITIPIVFLALSVFTSASFSDDLSRINYDYVSTNLFWNKLYAGGGWSLYCGYQFDARQRSPQEKVIEIEHVYPVDWMLDSLSCNNRMQCHEENNQRFKAMEADLHNMYPVWQALVTHRINREYGVIAGEEWRFNDCDFEWKGNLVEPRSIARGNIARSILYMHVTYSLPVPAKLMKQLKFWNKEDPPSKQEQIRNNRIEKLQGRRNPYIDDPELADVIHLATQFD